MRYSRHFGTTLREDPSEADTAGFRLLLRAGFVRPLASGIFSYLPLGYRVKEKIEQILREEMEAIGGQELLMPVVQPA
jgi:prolyl-tRNA synthetase